MPGQRHRAFRRRNFVSDAVAAREAGAAGAASSDQPLRSSQRVHRLTRGIVLFAGLILGVGLTVALAGWLSTGLGSGSALGASVGTPAAPTAAYDASSVRLTWAAVTMPDSSSVDGYDVVRHAGASSVVVCTASTPATTCTDDNPLLGTVDYGVLARKANWVSPEGARKTFVSDQTAPLTLASVSPTPNGAGWNNTAVSVSLSVTDAGGSGGKSLTYSIGGAAPVSVTGTSTSFSWSGPGTTWVTYYADDYAGNTESAKSLTLRIDTVAPADPTLTGISADTGVSSSDQITKTTAQILFGTAEAGSTVIVKRAGTTLATVTASGSGAFSAAVTLTSANAGVNNFTATATDVAGNVSVVSADFPVTLDTTKPGVPAFTALSDDTGVSLTDEITSVADQIVNGTAEVGSTVTVTRTVPAPVVPLGTTLTDGTGKFGYPMTLVANQATTLTATASDVAGNISTATGGYVVKVDQIAPTTGVNSITPAPNVAGWNRASTAVVIGQADTGSGGTDKVWTRVNVAAWSSGTGVTKSATVPTTLQGDNTVTYYAVDKAGNVGDTSTATVKMDSVAPGRPTITSISNDTGPSGTDKITNAASQTLSGIAEANSTVTVIRGGTTIASGAASSSGSYAIPITLIEGINTLTTKATDIADNVSVASTNFAVTLDTTMVAPALVSISNDSGSSATDQITSVAAQTLSGTADANSTVVVKRGGLTLATVTATGLGTFTAAVTLVPGVNTFTVISSDVAGNSATSANFPVTLDTAAPAAPAFTGISNDTGSSNNDEITNLADQTLSGSAETGSSVVVQRGVSTLAMVTATGGGFNAFATMLGGDNTMTATATDLAGNSSAASSNFVVSLDTQAPVATLAFPVNGGTYDGTQYQNGCTPTGNSVCGTVTDNLGMDRVVVLLYSYAQDACLLPPSSWIPCFDISGQPSPSLPTATITGTTWTFTTGVLPSANYTVAVEADDIAGNSMTTSYVSFARS